MKSSFCPLCLMKAKRRFAHLPRSFVKGGIKMSKYVCNVCGWVYDEDEGFPQKGIMAGTTFAELPEDFECELCGVGKENFSLEE